MKNHFISLFKAGNRKKTIILSIIAATAIMGSIITGISDNLPMIIMCFAGIVTLYFAMLHPWKKASHFVLLTVVCLTILVLDFIWPLISEEVAMWVGFICFAGVISGIIGIFTRLDSWKRLPFAGSLLSLVALGIFISMSIPVKEVIVPETEWIVIGTQLLVIISLFITGVVNKREKIFTKILLIVTSIALLVLSGWGFYASTWQFGDAAHSKVFVIIMLRFYAFVEIIAAGLSLFACK